MAAIRLRKAFHYPEESDGDSGREELNEQEQEQIILQLQHQNDARNAQYNVIFTILPLASTLAFGPSLFSASSVVQQAWSLLSVVSLFGTACFMRYSPLYPDRKGKNQFPHMMS
ncbi:hypothetical protein N7470_002980 [Penicillium chermesinum]|nr:hypothetical protein N7470_002980 [Penicillium chermesinum]